MRESFIDYSMSVNVQRALPDVRDGLKPVHRRILYAMSGAGAVAGPGLQEVRDGRGRGAGEVPSARGFGGLRRACANGAGVLAALSAGGRPGQLRLHRRRLGGGVPLHGSAVSSACPWNSWPTSTRKRSASTTTSTAASRNRRCSRRRRPICWSTARRGSRWGWRPTFPRTTSREVVDGLLALIDDPHLSGRRTRRDHQGARLPDGRIHLRPRGDTARVPHRARPGRHSGPRRHRGG